MTDLYNALNVSPNASKWQIINAYEKVVRSQPEIENRVALHALLILGSDKRRKYYDIIYPSLTNQKSDIFKKYANQLSKYENRLDYLLDQCNPAVMASRKVFWKTNLKYVLFRTFGLHYMWPPYGEERIVRDPLTVCVFHNILIYGPFATLAFFEPIFILPLILLIAVVLYINYRWIKTKYYNDGLINNLAAI